MTGAIITGIRSRDSTRARPRLSRLSSRASPVPITASSPTPTATSTPVFAMAFQKRGSWVSTRTKFWRPMNCGGKRLVPQLDLLLTAEPIGDRGPFLRHRVQRLLGRLLAGQRLVDVQVQRILVLRRPGNEDLGIAVGQRFLDAVQVGRRLRGGLEVRVRF